MDDSLGANDNEIIGCRCSIDFGYYFDKDKLDEGVSANETDNNIVLSELNYYGKIDLDEIEQFLDDLQAKIRNSDVENMYIIKDNGDVFFCSKNREVC